MSRDVHVRIFESAGVKFPRATPLMFQLTWKEMDQLNKRAVLSEEADQASSRSQFVILKRGSNIKYLPYAFTEQGVAMLSSVLHSRQAIQVNIAIMRAFVRLKQILYAHKELAHKLAELERKIEKHDEDIQSIFGAFRQLMVPPEKPKRRIGFHAD